MRADFERNTFGVTPSAAGHSAQPWDKELDAGVADGRVNHDDQLLLRHRVRSPLLVMDMQQPVQEQPVREQPVREQPVREQPVREQPMREQPVREQPVREQPVREQPVREQPVRGQPVREQPVREQPVREQPAQEQPPLLNFQQNSQLSRPPLMRVARNANNENESNNKNNAAEIKSHPSAEYKTNAKQVERRASRSTSLKQRLHNENISELPAKKKHKTTLLESIKPDTCSLKIGTDGAVSLPTFYEDVSPNPEESNVYLMETSSATNFTGRGLCSVESYCTTNPEAVVWFLVTSRSLSPASVRHLRALHERHPNLCVAYADFELLLQDTPLLALYKSDKFRDTKYLIHNLSDLSRLAVVYKSGGFYSDMDIFLMRNVHHLQNFLALENDATMYSSNGVFHFRRRHPFLLAVMRYASSHYDGYKWGSIGPATFTAVMKNPPCEVTIPSRAAMAAPCSSADNNQEYDQNTDSSSTKIILPSATASSDGGWCSLTALPQSTFYPITTRYLASLFNRSDDGSNDKPLQEIFPASVGVHLFNKLSQDMTPDAGSLVNKLAAAACPVINARTQSKL